MNIFRRRSRSLRSELVFNALVGVALPVALIGGMAFYMLTYHLDIIDASFERSRAALTNEIARTDLVGRADDTARHIDAFLVGRIVEAKSWASSDIVAAAARSAADRHAADGLAELPVAELEQRYLAREGLGGWPRAESYLRQQVASSPYFAEIFFTDRNGFNVAMTNPTSDFVQADEDWWKHAWAQGVSVGEVKYDDSAAVWSVGISIRIDPPDGGEPLGVMKAVLAIEPVQRIADAAARNVSGGRISVATRGGILIAETASGHDPERIMNPEINLRDRGEPSVSAGFGPEPSGFVIGRDWLTSYARTGGRDAYAPAAGRFAGLDWVVIVRKPVAAIFQPFGPLRGIDRALRDWRMMLALAFGITVVLCTTLAIALSLGIARRYASALAAVSEMAERSARGRPVGPPAIRDPEEIVRVNDAVRYLSELCRRAPQAGNGR